MLRWIWLVVVVAIGAAVLVVVGDVRELGARLDDFAWRALGMAVCLALANYAIRFARWQMYLRHQGVTIRTGSSALIFGAGLSLSITPGKVGELFKSYLLRELHDVPVTRTAPIIIAERVSDLVALLVLAVAGTAIYGVQPVLVAIAAAVVGSGLVLLAWPRPARALIDLVTRGRLTRRFREPLHEMYASLAQLCRPRLLALASAYAVPAWACECIGFAVIVNGFAGAHVELELAMVIYAATTIAGALSFLPGGLGVTEGAMIILLVQTASRLDHATALDATLLTRLATLWLAVLLGVGCLAIARARIAARARARSA